MIGILILVVWTIGNSDQKSTAAPSMLTVNTARSALAPYCYPASEDPEAWATYYGVVAQIQASDPSNTLADVTCSLKGGGGGVAVVLFKDRDSMATGIAERPPSGPILEGSNWYVKKVLLGPLDETIAVLQHLQESMGGSIRY